MPNTAAQKISATEPRSRARAPDPLCSSRSRASALRHLGVSTIQTLGRLGIEALTQSAVENGIELMIPHAASELEEEILEPQIFRSGLLLNLRHRSLRNDLALVHDGDTVAH